MEHQDRSYRDQRREFLLRAASLCGVTVCSGALAAMLASCETDTVKASGSTATLDIANAPSLQTVGGAVKQTFGSNNGGRPIIVVRTADNEFAAFSSVCTHAGCEVSAPTLPGDSIVCDQPGCGHGSVFSPTDGSVEFGPATSPLRAFSTSYDAEANRLTIHF